MTEAEKRGDALLARWATGPWNAPRNADCVAVFVALAQGKDIDPRFDGLLPLPIEEADEAVFDQCWAALPEERRLPALRRAYSRVRSTKAVQCGLRLLARVPDLEIAKAMMKESSECEIAPFRPARVRPQLEKLAKTHPALLAAIGKAPKKLDVMETTRPASAKELSSVQAAQLLAAARKYDGKKVPIEKRFGPDDGSETSFGKTIAFVTLGEGGKAKYDVVSLAGDSGSVFAHGKTREVAMIVQGGIETEDAGLAERLTDALAESATAGTKGGKP